MHVHFHEVREEVTAARQRTGRTAIGHAEATGMFQVPVIAAHSVWVDREDRERYATHGVGVAHNPVANGILASGIAPVAELRALGVPVGIGVDGPASNDSQDFLQAMKTAALLARVRDLQATAMSAREALEMGTIGGARALRMEQEIGSLEPASALTWWCSTATPPRWRTCTTPTRRSSSSRAAVRSATSGSTAS